jgi:hypothetical protein
MSNPLNDDPMFARGPETKELRGDAPTELVCALDALALVNDKTRHAYCLKVLAEHVEKEIHKHIVLANTLRGNPLLSEPNRSKPE